MKTWIAKFTTEKIRHRTIFTDCCVTVFTLAHIYRAIVEKSASGSHICGNYAVTGVTRVTKYGVMFWTGFSCGGDTVVTSTNVKVTSVVSVEVVTGVAAAAYFGSTTWAICAYGGVSVFAGAL